MSESYYDDYDVDDSAFMGRCDFADPGGESALRAATADNPRDQPCPTCKGEDLLTPQDVALGYQCDRCANAQERGF